MKKTLINVEIELLEDQLGTVPKSKEVYTKYIANKGNTEKNVKITPEMAEEEAEGVREDLEASGWTTFMEDNDGLYILNYLVLGMLRNAGSTLKEQVNIKQLKSKLENFVFVNPRKLRFERDGEVLKQCDGVLERPLRGMTAQGPRVTLAKSDIVNAGTRIKFQLTLLDHKEIKVETLKELLSYGEYCGLGQWRTSTHGSFKVISFEEVQA